MSDLTPGTSENSTLVSLESGFSTVGGAAVVGVVGHRTVGVARNPRTDTHPGVIERKAHIEPLASLTPRATIAEDRCILMYVLQE